jgi:hypothetical protein
MNRWTRRGRQAYVWMRRLPPYVIVDDGRKTGRPLIRLTRDCASSEVAHVIRALSTQLAGGVEAVAKCGVDLAGHRLTNDLGTGVQQQRAS